MPPMIRDKTSFDAIVDPTSSQNTLSLKRIWRKAMPRANPSAKRSPDGISKKRKLALYLLPRPPIKYLVTDLVTDPRNRIANTWDCIIRVLVNERDQALSDAADLEQKENWDPDSSLHQDEQERNLIKAWIHLGERGRSVGSSYPISWLRRSPITDARLDQLYRERCDDIPLPQHVPLNLSVFEKRRKVTGSGEWGRAAGAIWIRTWYGNEASPVERSGEGIVTRASADEAYSRLWRKALHPYQYHYRFDADMFGPFIFDDNDAAYGVATRDADDEVELMDDIPYFILSALMRCPDAMEGSSEREIMEEDDNTELQQSLLVVVADREACEEGWVLLLALNHRGQALHMRVRCKAYLVWEQVNHFRDGGEPLDITESKENLMDYLDGNRSGDGWDEDEPQA